MMGVLGVHKTTKTKSSCFSLLAIQVQNTIFFMAVHPLDDTVKTCIHTACRTFSEEMSQQEICVVPLCT
jgi:hypothetical protein